MIRPTPRRRRGDLGERAALRYLRRRGIRILAKNYTAFSHEIDIVAEEREHLLFIEVKTRRLRPEDATVLTKPAAAVDKEKQRHIISAAKCWLATHEIRKKCRFDIIEVYLDPSLSEKDRVLEIRHIPGAFTA
jgi:putative endonuclease